MFDNRAGDELAVIAVTMDVRANALLDGGGIEPCWPSRVRSAPAPHSHDRLRGPDADAFRMLTSREMDRPIERCPRAVRSPAEEGVSIYVDDRGWCMTDRLGDQYSSFRLLRILSLSRSTVKGSVVVSSGALRSRRDLQSIASCSFSHVVDESLTPPGQRANPKRTTSRRCHRSPIPDP